MPQKPTTDMIYDQSPTNEVMERLLTIEGAKTEKRCLILHKTLFFNLILSVTSFRMVLSKASMLFAWLGSSPYHCVGIVPSSSAADSLDKQWKESPLCIIPFSHGDAATALKEPLLLQSRMR